MTINAVVSMAILKVNSDRLGRSVLDNFEPFVLDRLYHSRAEVVSVPELRDALSYEYGIDIPGGVLQTLTKRIARKKLLGRDHGVLHIDRESLSGFDLTQVRGSAERNYEQLTQAGAEYASREYNLSLTADQFGAALLDFIRNETVPLLKTVVEGRPIIADPAVEVGSMQYIVASFVVDAFHNNQERYSALSTVVKGGVIASALYFPDPAGMDRRLDGLLIFLDTTLLLRLTGACGPEFERMASDLASLAVARGARLLCFEHTIKECRGVLEACARAVKRRTGRYFGEATDYMVSAGWENSDVVEFSERFEDRLSELGVTIQSTPEHKARFTVDEERLDGILQEEVHYSSQEAKLKDLDSITSIHRLRRGLGASSLGRARAVFATTNTALVRASRKFSKVEELERGAIPLCVPDYFLTTALWVTQEIAAPDLPSKKMVADCFSAMRVDDHLWRLYIEKIEELRESRVISEDDYILLRQSLEVRALIMFDTSEDPENFTAATVEKVLEKARSSVLEEAEAAAAVSREELEEQRKLLERERREGEARDETSRSLLAAQQEQVRLKASWLAKLAAGCAVCIGGVLALIGAFFSFPSLLEQRPAGVFGFIISIAIAVFLALSMISILTERGLPFVRRWVESTVERRILRWVYGDASDLTL